MSGLFDSVTDSHENRRAFTHEHHKVHDHTPLNRAVALELAVYSQHAYDDPSTYGEGETFIENHTIGINDLQLGIYEKREYVVLAFRGTDWITDALTDVDVFTTHLSSHFDWVTSENDLKVHDGFCKSLARVYDQLKEKLMDVLNGRELWVTGHSYGAALSTIFSYVWTLDTGYDVSNVYAFGSPRVFVNTNEQPVSRYGEVVDNLLRVQMNDDPVTYYPNKGTTHDIVNHAKQGAEYGSIIGAVVGAVIGWMSGGFCHVGTGIILFERGGETLVTNEGVVRLPEQQKYYVCETGDDSMRNPLSGTNMDVSAHSISVYVQHVNDLPALISESLNMSFSLDGEDYTHVREGVYKNRSGVLHHVFHTPDGKSYIKPVNTRALGFFYYNAADDLGKLVSFGA